MVKAHRVYEQYQAATTNDTTFSYTASYNDLKAMEGTTGTTKKPGQNNPDKVELFVTEQSCQPVLTMHSFI